MPNTGDAKYNGNWVAAVRRADEQGNGDISLTNGVATFTADFGKDTIKATLAELATLTGTVAGNTFSGTKATVVTNTLGLNAAADFTGTFGGGFYGAQAAEAAGVFDFTSKDAEDGEFPWRLRWREVKPDHLTFQQYRAPGPTTDRAPFFS